MAFDGIVISNIVHELKDKLIGGRIVKIAQPEKDELLLTIKNQEQYKLFISANAGMPLIYLTEQNKVSPMTAPNFCMLLRKHLNSARILDITQPGLERIVRFTVEHLDEMGDRCVKYLIVEIMGKHSNIIFCDDELTILDSIKRVPCMVSSVREVLPGRTYFEVKTEEKLNPLCVTEEEFCHTVLQKPLSAAKSLYMTLTGISPMAANELCFRASIEADRPITALTEAEGIHLFRTMARLAEDVKSGKFHPNVVFRGTEPVEFSSITLMSFPAEERKEWNSISELLSFYYTEKNTITCIRQKSAMLRKTVATALERASKKLDLQFKQQRDTEDRDQYRVYGELLTTYGYGIEAGARTVTVQNYYTDSKLTIPLDPQKTPMENAKRYFDKYSKQKRTYEALVKQLTETEEEVVHLDSIKTALDIALKEEDLAQIREELTEYGYLRRSSAGRLSNGKKQKKDKVTSKPFHFISSDGFHIYVGKNNFQNDELTFSFAEGNDWWFHAKGIPGSHVVVKSKGMKIPNRTFEEAGNLAAFYSKGRDNQKVEVDYTEKKNVKKPSGGKPGFVIYYTNYSMMCEPERAERIEAES